MTPPDRRYYIGVETDLFSHPKTLALGDALAFRHLRAIAWCHRQLTDGFVPAAALPEIRVTKRDVAALLDAGLWSASPVGFEIHDYLRHQPSKAEMRRRSEAGTAAANARWSQPGASESHPNRMPNASETQSETNAQLDVRRTSDSEKDDDASQRSDAEAQVSVALNLLRALPWYRVTNEDERMLTEFGESGVDVVSEVRAWTQRARVEALRYPRAALKGWLRVAAKRVEAEHPPERIRTIDELRAAKAAGGAI